MASGIIASISGSSGSATYTPSSDAQVLLACTMTSAGSAVSVNASYVAVSAGNSTYQVKLFVAAGQTITVTTSAAAYCTISALES